MKIYIKNKVELALLNESVVSVLEKVEDDNDNRKEFLHNLTSETITRPRRSGWPWYRGQGLLGGGGPAEIIMSW